MDRHIRDYYPYIRDSNGKILDQCICGFIPKPNDIYGYEHECPLDLLYWLKTQAFPGKEVDVYYDVYPIKDRRFWKRLFQRILAENVYVLAHQFDYGRIWYFGYDVIRILKHQRYDARRNQATKHVESNSYGGEIDSGI